MPAGVWIKIEDDEIQLSAMNQVVLGVTMLAFDPA
jgi:hypothetical protein